MEKQIASELGRIAVDGSKYVLMALGLFLVLSWIFG